MTVVQYIEQISAHRRRMAAVAAFFQDESPSGTRLVRARLRWHDIEKWIFLPLLIPFRCGQGNRNIARAVYGAMNFVGGVIGFFLNLFLSRNIVDTLRAERWERILDCVDRNLDPVARIELGDEVNGNGGPPLSNFLTHSELDDSEWLRDRWPWA